MSMRQWLSCCFLLSASTAFGQRVHGVVLNRLSHDPVPGAVVSVLDSGGTSLARDLTNAAGRYSLSISSRVARLRVVRIGFSPQETTLAAATADGELDITLDPLPSLLQRVSVSAAAECPSRPDQSQALGLWEQARAALLASVAARETRPGDMQILEYRRMYDDSKRVLYWQQERVVASHTARPFVPVAAASVFAARGFRVASGGDTVLAAPDADILLDDGFAATHCFRIVQSDSAHPGEVGLAFAPAPARDHLVDIRGALWIDRDRASLVSLEFRYTGLSHEQTAGGSGGRMEFRTMPNGVVFIDRWSIDAVSGRPYMGAAGNASGGRSVVIVSGGEITTARWDDSTRWVAKMASVRGRITGGPGTDSGGVRVWLPGTADTTTSDSTGHFRFDGLLPGRYRVAAAAAPTLAAVGIAQNVSQDSANATLADTGGAIVHLDSASVAARGVCGNPHGAMPFTVLLLRVSDGDHWNVPWDSVTATWKAPSTRVLGIPIGHQGRRLAMTDPDGRAALCNLPSGEPVGVLVGPHWRPQVSASVTVPRDHPVVLMTVQLKRPQGH